VIKETEAVTPDQHLRRCKTSLPAMVFKDFVVEINVDTRLRLFHTSFTLPHGGL
jgi:hypothetical protein